MPTLNGKGFANDQFAKKTTTITTPNEEKLIVKFVWLYSMSQARRQGGFGGFARTPLLASK